MTHIVASITQPADHLGVVPGIEQLRDDDRRRAVSRVEITQDVDHRATPHGTALELSRWRGGVR